MRSDHMLWKGSVLLLAAFFLGGCASAPVTEEQPKSYTVAGGEAEWIRNGDPIGFEGALWFPTDNVENLFDSELYLAGEYKEANFYIEKADVRPFNRLYTKFSKNRFRVFERKESR